MIRKADLVVVGTSLDPHIDAVVDRLGGDIDVCRLDVDQYPKSSEISIRMSGTHTEAFVRDQNHVPWDVSRPSLLWFRRLGKPGLPKRLHDAYRDFANGEVEQTIEGLLSTITPGHTLNDFWATRRAGNKPRQYAFAAETGLLVPRTLVSNSPAQFKAWAHGDVIAKSLSRPLLTDERSSVGRTFAYTHRLTSEDYSHIDEISRTPVQFQPLVEAAYEIRVTSLRGKHHAIAIESTDAEPNRFDWRATATECTYRATELTHDTSANLTQFLRRLGIDFAASDFIVDKDGREWFLESNPNGAWMWLEAFVGEFDFTSVLARHITKTIRASKPA